MSPAPDAVVRRLVADAELLLWAAAPVDLPAGLRIIDIGDAPTAGVAVGTGHRLALAHRGRPGAVAVGVAARAIVGDAFARWPGRDGIATDEAQLVIEAVTAHELAHALVADGDGAPDEAVLAVLRDLPSLVAGTAPALSSPVRMARDHGGRWAGALVILGRRCGGIRPLSRAAWASVIEADLRRYGIDADAVAEALGPVPADACLRELLAEGGPAAERLALTVPSLGDRITAIGTYRTPPAEPGHVAPVGDGGALEVTKMIVDVLSQVRARQDDRATGIEEVAARLAAGEAVGPDEVEAVLHRTGRTVDDLQARVACLRRRAELRTAIEAGRKAEKRLGKIRAEVDAARVVVNEAAGKLHEIEVRHAEDTILLEQAVRDAGMARDRLLAPENLTVTERERLTQAREAVCKAEAELLDGLTTARRCSHAVGRAEEELPEAVEEAKRHPASTDMAERVERLRVALATRREKLAEAKAAVPGLEAALEQARAERSKAEAELAR